PFALFANHRRSSITDAVIELAIRTETQAVQVMANKPDSNAVSVAERLLYISNALALRVPQEPQIRDVGEVNVPVARQHTGGNALRAAPKPARKTRGFVGAPTPASIPDQSQPFRIFGIPADPAAPVFGHVGHALFHRPNRQFLVEPIHMSADIGNARE